MITYLFPGQGAQKTGMGSDLFDRYPEYVKKADQILGYSIRDLCLNGPEEKLSQTNYAQPALFVVNALSYISQVEHIGAEPDFIAGHSLGEYNALFASQVFDFETGLQLVKKRGELMAEVQDGGMAAVIGLSDDKIEEILRNSIDTIDIANYNTPAQVVISGKKKSIEDAQQIFEKAGARMYIPLTVGGAFHSRYMKEASENFRKFLNDFSFSTIKIPVIANITALPYLDNEIKENLANQICNPVQWLNSMVYLCEFENMLFKEIGESKILTNMLKKIPTVFV
jgi:trans-AT polyketide synthase/acyltransferase/oxidoreductase domain-containing protein